MLRVQILLKTCEFTFHGSFPALLKSLNDIVNIKVYNLHVWQQLGNPVLRSQKQVSLLGLLSLLLPLYRCATRFHHLQDVHYVQVTDVDPCSELVNQEAEKKN